MSAPPTLRPLRKNVADCRNDIHVLGGDGARLTSDALMRKAIEKTMAPREAWRGWSAERPRCLVAVDMKCRPAAGVRARWYDVLLPTGVANTAVLLADDVKGVLSASHEQGLHIHGSDLAVWGADRHILGNLDLRASILAQGCPGELLPPPRGLAIPYVARVGELLLLLLPLLPLTLACLKKNRRCAAPSS